MRSSGSDRGGTAGRGSSARAGRKTFPGQLLACGADILEINTIRKRLSGVNDVAVALLRSEQAICYGQK